MPVTTIQEQINNRVAEVAQSANLMPGVITIHDLRDWSIIWMSDRGLNQLNITQEDIAGKALNEYHKRFFNPEDAKDYVPKLIALLERNNNDELCTYFEQVRFPSNPNWTWHMSSVKILLHDEKGKPLLVIAFSIPVDAMHHMTVKAGRLLEENNFLRSNYHKFAELSKRECGILRLMALGKTAPDISEALFISINTVETHRKNIKKKLGTSSSYELSQYARAFDLI
jgi:DNA-binding CsgD family transcriptional regulator